MIKVFHICDKFGVKGSSVHGVSRLFAWWMPLFDQSRFDVKLIGLRSPDQACSNLVHQGIAVISLNRGKFDPRTILDIIKLIRQHNPDILHLHGYGASNFGRIAGRFTQTITILHEHFVDPAIPHYQVVVDYFLRNYTDYSIAVSNSVKNFMIERRYFPRHKTVVIYNGAPLKDFQPYDQISKSEERKRWEILENEQVIGTIGRLDNQKGIKYLIDAFAILLQNYNNIKLIIVGDGPLENDLKTQCNYLGIQKAVVFTGYCSNVASISSIIDIQVFPSLWEGTPLTLFEAMAMKKCIVSTNVDGLGEILEHNKNALVVPAESHELLAESIEKVLLDSSLQKDLARRAFKDSENFDIGNTVKSMEKIYTDLLNISRPKFFHR
jgi:glycosyltransferase involved in cell wall biosynthesis